MDRTMAGESIYPDKTPTVSFGNIKSTDLSKREIEVLREVIMGFTNAEIAERLNLSQHTVRDYVQVIMEKTGYRTRTELAVKARETGIIIPDKKN
jgi:two-component system vancomycin resistance associated response regulator VraR